MFDHRVPLLHPKTDPGNCIQRDTQWSANLHKVKDFASFGQSAYTTHGNTWSLGHSPAHTCRSIDLGMISREAQWPASYFESEVPKPFDCQNRWPTRFAKPGVIRRETVTTTDRFWLVDNQCWSGGYAPINLKGSQTVY